MASNNRRTNFSYNNRAPQTPQQQRQFHDSDSRPLNEPSPPTPQAHNGGLGRGAAAGVDQGSPQQQHPVTGFADPSARMHYDDIYYDDNYQSRQYNFPYAMQPVDERGVPMDQSGAQSGHRSQASVGQEQQYMLEQQQHMTAEQQQQYMQQQYQQEQYMQQQQQQYHQQQQQQHQAPQQKQAVHDQTEEQPPQDHHRGVRAARRTKPAKGGNATSKLNKYRDWVDKQKAKTKGPITRFEQSFDAFWQKWIIEFVLRQYPLPPSKDGRHVPVTLGDARKEPFRDDRRGGKPYLTNHIRSSRYSIWSFLPKQLYFQFSKLGNFYFLVVGSLQLVPNLSTTGSWTTIGPLILFVAISMAKEGWDDFRRYKLDRSENRSSVWVFDPYEHGHGIGGKQKPSKHETSKDMTAKQLQLDDATSELYHPDFWKPLLWQDVRVGDIIRLTRDASAPADMVLLHATGANGIAYIDTAALDGETNLKSKQASKLLSEQCTTMETLAHARPVVVSEDPNLDLYSFDGRVNIGNETLPLTQNEVVYRGSTLRNTASALGVVINTGEECKIRMNAKNNIRTKAPAMQNTINGIIFVLVLAVCLLGGGLTIGFNLWRSSYWPNAWYLQQADVPQAQIVVGYIIMFYALIPLSLYVSMEIIKVGQFILLQDVDMYDPETDTPMTANTTTILENLGQVSYVFSDKTGTLTENKMRFRKFTVAGTPWVHDVDLRREAEARRAYDEQKGVEQEAGGPCAAVDSATATVVHPNELNSDELTKYLREHPSTAFATKARHFLLCIALCHTCIPEHKKNGEIEFQSSSPDELALVQAARDLGFVLVDRPTQSIVLQLLDERGQTVHETYQVLDVIEFSSKRKRMSIVIRLPDGRITVLCKGADSAIMPRLRQAKAATKQAADVGRRASRRRSMQAAEEASRRRSTGGPHSGSPFIQSPGNYRQASYGMANGNEQQHYQQQASHHDDGRHAAVIDESVAENDEAIFERCFQHINEFASDGLRTLLYGYRYISDEDYSKWKKIYHEASTSLENRQQKIEEAGEMIEKDFDLAGATAIEDKLQAGVPDTIDKLRRANIKVWMLTGDKRETAINIAHAARIIKPFSELYITDSTEGELVQQISHTLDDIQRDDIAHSVLVVDGGTLGTIEKDEALRAMFFDLVVKIDSVICCRASPAQKATLVKHIRDTVPKSLTLAIGDGANDIAMIQASHVGIGIAGKEGLQAARISDFAIGQFRFLQKLLFVHGRWNYLRTGRYVLATFWKEIVFYICQAQYQTYNGYTGTSLYENWSLTLFNVIFTSLPVIIPGIFEKDLRASTLLAVPELYTYGQRNKAFNFGKYLGWMLMGAIETVLIYKLISAMYGYVNYTDDNSIFAMGEAVFLVCVAFINIKLFVLELHNKTVLSMSLCVISIGAWFIWNIILAASNIVKPSPSPYPVHNSFTRTFGRQLIWWTGCLLALAAAVVFELVVTSLRRVYFPEDQDLWQEIEKLHKVEEVIREHNADTNVERGEDGGATGAKQKHVSNPFDDDAGTPSASSPQSGRPHQQQAYGHGNGTGDKGKMNADVAAARSNDWPLRRNSRLRHGDGTPIELDEMDPSPRR